MAVKNPMFVISGEADLDRKIRRMVLEDGPKSVNAAARKATRAAAKIVLDDAKASVAHDTGKLESSLTVRTASRRGKRKNFVGHTITTREGMFESGRFYGGYLEYGTKNMEADEYLRPALYGNEDKIRSVFMNTFRGLIEAAGQ